MKIKMEKVMGELKLFKSERFRGYVWFEEARNFLKEKVCITYTELRDKYRQLSNGDTKKLFLEYTENKIITLRLRGKGNPVYFIYDSLGVFPRLKKYWDGIFLSQKGLPDSDIIKAFNSDEIKHIKRFIHTHFRNYIDIDANGIYWR